MAVQIHAPWPVNALTLYAIIRNADGQAWNGAAFENYATANLANYDVPLAQQGTAARYYVAAFPAAITAGIYSITVHQQAGGAPAEADTLLMQDWYRWDGDSLEPVQTGDSFARLGAPAGASVSADIADKTGYALSADGVDAIWDEVITGHATADSFGKVFDDQVDGLRAYGDSGWATATGFSTHTAAAVWAVATRVLTANTNLNDPTVATIADAVWDEAKADHIETTTFGDLATDLNTVAVDVAGLDGAAMRGTDSAALASVCTELRLAELDTANLPTDVDTIKADLPGRPAKGIALANFGFLMVDSTDHVTGKTALTVTAQISKDGGAFAACTNSVSEIANGLYKITLTTTEMNANVVVLRFTATGADPTVLTILTQVT